MVPEATPSTLVHLVQLIDQAPLPAQSPRRGRPVVYSERLILKALVSMGVRRLPTVHALLAVLEEPNPAWRALRALLTENGRFPSRRTWERRLGGLVDDLPLLIATMGQHLLTVLGVWEQSGRAAAIDSTTLKAHGRVWHKKDREAGRLPHASIDVEAHWKKSGWHGWIYGWGLHLVSTVGPVWVPLAATLPPGNLADNEVARDLLPQVPSEVRFLLGDTRYQDAELRRAAAAQGAVLLTPRRGGRRPRTDAGATVRAVFHALRNHTCENVNEQFKAIFHLHEPVPTRGQRATARYVLGAVLAYQLAIWARHQRGVPLARLRVGLKPFLQAA